MKLTDPPKINQKKRISQNKDEKKDFFEIDKLKLKGQMVGSTPGVEAEELISFNTKLFDFFKNFDYEKPNKMVSELFEMEFIVEWIKDSLVCELEKSQEEQLKNSELKKQLGATVQNLLDSFCAILDTKKVGYLIEVIIQKNIDTLLSVSYLSKINISEHAIKRGPGGNMDGLSSLLAYVPSAKDVSLQRSYFGDKDNNFRIKGGSVDQQDKTGGWKPIEEIAEYTYINPELVTSKNIINLMAFDDFLFNNFKLPVFDIPLKEKLYLYNFLLTNNLYQLHKFVSVYNHQDKNINFFRAFLSIEHGGGEMGDKILKLGEKLPKEMAEKVFAKYGEIVDVADRAEEEIQKLYEKENIPNKVPQSVKEVLLKKGAEFLSGLAEKDNLANEKEVLRELENIKTETMILGSSYLELFRSGERINFDEIKGTTVEKISSENLSEEQKNEIISAYKNGRPKETYENEEHLKLLTNEFSENLNKKETYVFNIRFKGEIIAFADFQKIDEDTFHIGGLTFLEDVRNPVVAEAVMNSIMKEFSKYNIVAEVHGENKILNMYKKRLGFKIVGEMPREENAGELYFKIKREKDSSDKENSLNFKTAA